MIARRLNCLMIVIAVTTLLSACSRDTVVVDEMKALADGESIAYKLGPGVYRLDFTASDGASAEWVGASCPASGEVKVYSSLCELKQDGQLIIKNPTVWGNGATSSVTIKLTRIR